MDTFKSLIDKESTVSVETLKRIAMQVSDDGLPDELRNVTLAEEQRLNRHLAEHIDTMAGCIEAAFGLVNPKYFAGPVNVVDWNCGQGVSTVCLNDYLSRTFPSSGIKAIKLVEPSQQALERALTVVRKACQDIDIRTTNKAAGDVISDNLRFADGVVLHIFNDLLNCEGIDFKSLASRITVNANCTNVVVGCGKCYFQGNRRTAAFIDYLCDAAREVKMCRNNSGSETIFSFVVDSDKCAELLKRQLPAPTCMGAAYMLDCVGGNAKAAQQMLRWAGFEVYSPFYAASEISDDIHPLLAVANNIVTRGVPTLASPNMEQAFAVFFGLTHRKHRGSQLRYESNMEKAIGKELLQCLSRGLAKNAVINQMAFTPIEVARIHKVAIEAMLSGRLDINSQYWNVLVIEHDVPCGALAMRDLEELFNHLAGMTSEYGRMALPQIRLEIISPQEYLSSPLHLGYAPATNLQKQHYRRKYDLVIESSIERCDSKDYALPQLTVKNNCIFGLFSTKNRTANIPQTVYTSKRHINYNKDAARSIDYMLALLFRYERADNGIIKALSHSLQGEPVLAQSNDDSTGMMVATTAAMLQPGMTLMISVTEQNAMLRSRNLKAVGIDCCPLGQKMPSKEFGMALSSIEDSCCQLVSAPSRLLADINIARKFAALERQCIYTAMYALFDADAVSLWSQNFDPFHAMLPRIMPGNNGMAAIAVAPIMPADVAADMMAAISPTASPRAVKTATLGIADRCQVQFAVERVPAFDDNEASTIGNIDNFDAIQQSRLKFLGNYLNKLPLMLREFQTTDALMRINENFTARTGNTAIAATVPMPDNYLESKTGTGYEHGGAIFTIRNNNKEVEQWLDANGAKAISMFTSEYDDNDLTVEHLEDFAADKYPLAVLPMAMPLCAEKSNIRFAVNLCCPNSIEQLMTLASICGRDGRMSIVSTLLPHFSLCRLRDDGNTTMPKPMQEMNGHWVTMQQFEDTCRQCQVSPMNFKVDVFDKAHDLLRINCAIDNDIFMSHLCNYCKDSNNCPLSNDTTLPSLWISANDYDDFLREHDIDNCRTIPESLAAGYNRAIPCNDSWGRNMLAQRRLMQQLLKQVHFSINGNEASGLLGIRGMLDCNQSVNVTLTINEHPALGDAETVVAALHMLAQVGIIDNCGIDNAEFRLSIAITKHTDGFYCRQLLQQLLRYLPQHEAEDIANEACNKVEFSEAENAIEALWQFAWRKHTAVCKRATIDIEDMYISAAYNDKGNRRSINEYIKDYLHSYYHSPFLRPASGNEGPEMEYSLASDTNHGRKSSLEILAKYAQLIGTFDDAPNRLLQLHGAVRRLLRSELSSGTLSMLDALCMIALGYNHLPLLACRIADAYRAGYTLLRKQYGNEFIDRWGEVKPLLGINDEIAHSVKMLETLELDIEIQAHNEWLNNFLKRYGT